MTKAWRVELLRLARFGLVGVAATLVHMAVSISLVAGADWPLQRANLVAFACGLALSFFGHYHFSFFSRTPYRTVLPRFVLVSVLGYLCSTLAIALLARAFPGHRVLAVTLGSLLIPAVSYLVNRFFVFHDGGQRSTGD